MTGVGRHLLVGLRPTLDLHDGDRRLLSTVRPAGIIVYRGNFDLAAPYEVWHARFAQLVADARQAIGRDSALICIDHEGGTVLRPPAPVTRFAFARRWADRAAAVGQAMGVELASLGINVNFAPVVDIDSNPNNPVIGPRAFGTTAPEVTAAARPFIDAMQREGVVACLKHFPGHGDTSVDSHWDLPVLDLDLVALFERELSPYSSLISSGSVRLIMSAHILFPRIDSQTPATLSPRLIQDILRSQLRYGGVVVTDNINMSAVSAMFDRAGMMGRLLAAGTDLVMICGDSERAYDLLEDLERSVRDREVPSEALEASTARIDALLAALPLNRPKLLDPAVFASHATLAPLQQSRGVEGQTVSLEEEG
jgi:beta-N-acetylhexosaminidase